MVLMQRDSVFRVAGQAQLAIQTTSAAAEEAGDGRDLSWLRGFCWQRLEALAWSRDTVLTSPTPTASGAVGEVSPFMRAPLSWCQG